VPKVDNEAIGRALRAAREKVGLTQAQLAETIGVTNETISRVERGAYEPAFSTMVALAQALNFRIDSMAAGVLAGEVSVSTSPLVRRLAERASQLEPEAIQVLIRLAELLPVRPAGWDKKRKPRQGA
jgi:transcriptional regulator with XRE-family HTH domain